MKIRTKQLIVRLTAATISLGFAGTTFGIAVAQSKVAPVIAQVVPKKDQDTCSPDLMFGRQQLDKDGRFAGAGDLL
jgi:hypothetical protein